MKIASPNISASLTARTKTLQGGAITSNVLKSPARGKISLLIGMHGKGLRLKVL